ncbi:ROK family protein [Shouchella shacheensis]|uniref:ROK family protein n=1 Tax=Shouchella shacheensis TaxID=1649580 RepID=UPI00073FD079|nr:ROK family protein [Shouchella shacheensis]
MLDNWIFLELGGSSSQTIIYDQSKDSFSFHPGILNAEKCIALACPGLIKENMVYYATNLGWPDKADPRKELNAPSIQIVENDVVAASLGESVLRSENSNLMNLHFISLGTGVGSASVFNNQAYDLDLGHLHIGGKNYCEGCRSFGCLNSELESKRLPKYLSNKNITFIAEKLATAIGIKNINSDALLALGGGISRGYPEIAQRLDELIPNNVEVTVTPEQSKSAAFAGLYHLVSRRLMEF